MAISSRSVSARAAETTESGPKLFKAFFYFIAKLSSKQPVIRYMKLTVCYGGAVHLPFFFFSLLCVLHFFLFRFSDQLRLRKQEE